MVKVEVTAAAEEQVRKIMERQGKDGQALRLYVQGGGCSGLTYGMSFDHEETGSESDTGATRSISGSPASVIARERG